MAYNLRTGLVGSGDIDINVSMNDITATNITSGTFDAARIPNLSATKITTDELGVARIPNLSANKITSDELNVARIPNLSANKITSDKLGVARIPDLSATKITSGELGVARIPNLSATKITSDELDAARIPDLSANKITSDQLNVARIPNIPASKVAPGEALTNNIQATLVVSTTTMTAEGDLGCEGSFDCEGNCILGNSAADTVTCNGIVTCESDFNVDGHSVLGNALTDRVFLKGKLLTSGSSHVDAEYPIRPPGYASSYSGGSGTVYTRKIQILPRDFHLNDDQSYYNLSTYDLYASGYLTTNTSGFGAIKTHSTSHEMFAFVSIPEGYNVWSYKIFGVILQPNSDAAQSFQPLTTVTVDAYKVTFDNGVRNSMGSGYVGSEVSVNAQTFDVESYMIIEVVSTSQLDGILGGWVHIEPA